MLNRSILSILFLIVVQARAYSDEFYVNGTNDIFCVTDDAIIATPTWNPETGPIPVSVASAIKVASNYHHKKLFEGFIQYHTWKLAGATLVRHDDRHWYWIVQFRGVFDPKNKRGNDGRLIGGYSYPGPKTLYNRIPVLFDGKLATIRPEKPPLPAAIREITDDSTAE